MPTNEVVLSAEQRVELSSIAQSSTLPAGYVFRARLIIMLAEGVSFNTIPGGADDHAMEDTVSRLRYGWTGYSSPGPICQGP
jgi:hypothetical protein